MPTMLPLMDKDTVRYITQNITPDEAEYVAGIQSTIADTKCDVKDVKCDDIIYLTKILAFYTKVEMISSGISDINYKSQVDNLRWALQNYKEQIFPVVQAIIGIIKGSDISKVELPVSDNPLEIVNEVKQAVQNFITCHKDDVEYAGAVAISSQFLAEVHKAVYTFRLCKISAPDYDADECKCCNQKIIPIAAENVIKF